MIPVIVRTTLKVQFRPIRSLRVNGLAAVLTAFTIVLTGCSGDGVICIDDPAQVLRVSVVDAQNRTILDVPATLRVTNSSGQDHPSGATVASSPSNFVVYGYAGTYNLSVTAAGYQQFTKQDIRVSHTGGACPQPIPVDVSATMSKSF